MLCAPSPRGEPRRERSVSHHRPGAHLHHLRPGSGEDIHGECAACFIDSYDDEFDPEGPAFECAGYDDGTGFYCPLWGSEECDWECPNGGME